MEHDTDPLEEGWMWDLSETQNRVLVSALLSGIGLVVERQPQLKRTFEILLEAELIKPLPGSRRRFVLTDAGRRQAVTIDRLWVERLVRRGEPIEQWHVDRVRAAGTGPG